MSDTPLVQRTPPSPGSPGRGAARPRLLLALISVLILAAVVAGVLWYFLGRQQAPDWARLQDVVLAAPAGDAFNDKTPWVVLDLAPMKPGETNTLRLALKARQGTPIASEAANPGITELTIQPVANAGAAAALELQPDPAATGALTATAQFDAPGWWKIEAAVDGAEAPARFYLLFPDPNINGPAAVPDNSSSAEGEALYQRALAALTSLQSVRYTQWLSDGIGNAGMSEHAITAGGNGEPGGFTFRQAGGMEAVIIGSTRWVKLPGNLGWTKQEGAMSVPPSEWGEEYQGATGFTILGEETIDGAPAQVLAFTVPEITEPRRQTAAWYLWWVDTESGTIVEESMVSRVHYMHNEFSDFDVPITLVPPEEPATPAATPAA